MQAVSLDQFNGFAAIEAWIIGRIGNENKCSLMQFAAFPLPDVVDEADLLHVSQGDAQFLHHLASDGLPGSLTGLDAAAWRTVENSAIMRVHVFGDEEGGVAAENAESGLASFDLHRR
jgi:hypothetical protein